MAMNPMQRRARNSFLIGFVLALIIMAVVVMLLLYKIKGVTDEANNLKALQKKVYVASNSIESGEEVTFESLSMETVQLSKKLMSDELVDESDFEFYDEETGDSIPTKILARIDIPAGSVITKEMLEAVDDKTTDDQRIQEYNMIILPTMLESGSYIDIRLQLPEGEDYIVVSKKEVLECDASTIWLKMSEDEILTLGNAIVEAYTIVGSKLYATTYSEAGRQSAAIPTYPVSQAVLNLINNDPNVIKDAKDTLWKRYNDQEQVEQRNDHINKALESYYGNMKDSVEAGLQEELMKRQEARQQYVDSIN